MASYGGFPVHNYGMDQISNALIQKTTRQQGLDQQNLWNQVDLARQTGGGAVTGAPGQVNEMLDAQQKQQQATMKLQNDVHKRKIFNETLKTAESLSKVGMDDKMPVEMKKNLFQVLKNNAENAGIEIEFTPYMSMADAVNEIKDAKRKNIYDDSGSLKAFNSNPTPETHGALMADLDLLKDWGDEVEGIKMAANSTMLDARKKQATQKAAGLAKAKEGRDRMQHRADRSTLSLQQALQENEDRFNMRAKLMIDPEFKGVRPGQEENYTKLLTEKEKHDAIIRQQYDVKKNPYGKFSGVPGPDKKLTEEDARAIMAEAGGDAGKARLIAKERGFTF